MTKNHRHDYLPAAQHDALLPTYDLLSRMLGVGKVHQTLIAQAEIVDDQRVLEIGSGTGNLTLRAKRAHPGAELIGVDPVAQMLNKRRFVVPVAPEPRAHSGVGMTGVAVRCSTTAAQAATPRRGKVIILAK